MRKNFDLILPKLLLKLRKRFKRAQTKLRFYVVGQVKWVRIKRGYGRMSSGQMEKQTYKWLTNERMS